MTAKRTKPRDIAFELDTLNRRLGLEGEDRWTLDVMQPGDYTRKYRVVDGRDRPMFGTSARFTAREMYYMLRAAQSTLGVAAEAKSDRVGSPQRDVSGEEVSEYPAMDYGPGGPNHGAVYGSGWTPVVPTYQQGYDARRWPIGALVTRRSDGQRGRILVQYPDGNLRVLYQDDTERFVLAAHREKVLLRG